MKYYAYFHIFMLNDWKGIVEEQLDIMKRSGLYDKLDMIKVGVIGDVSKLNDIRKKYPKLFIAYESSDPIDYEFKTLRLIWEDSHSDKPFFGLYFHTKGVSYPGNEGGKYWRDYMNHYNLKEWKQSEKQLRKGYDTCGVKYMDGTQRPYKKHYSGNYFWFKSSYVKKLPDPLTLNTKDRYQAEFWSGMADPNAATLCQDFVDYRTKGQFKSGKNYVHTLAFNLPSETEKSVKLLYDQNDNFTHYLVDLGFPLSEDKIPSSIESEVKRNSETLKNMAHRYGSIYLKMNNIGVSQNWEQVYRHIGLMDDDVLIGADPDERPKNKGWVKAMSDVLRSGFGLVSLMMTDHVPLLQNEKISKVDGYNVMINPRNVNWALIGMTGEFIRGMGGVPYPKNAERYGWIEAEIRPYFERLNTKWGILPDYRVQHTDFWEQSASSGKSDEGTSSLLREWKNLIIFQIRKYGQISFEEFLQRKINVEL